MNNELPIVVKPARWLWGARCFFAAMLFAVCVYYLFFATPEGYDSPGGKVFITIMTVLLGFAALKTGWECIAPPVAIIDEDGIGGRFIGGGFVGTTRIAWDDITGARIVKGAYLVLDVNNSGDKYRPENKRRSAFANAFFNLFINYEYEFKISHWLMPVLAMSPLWRLMKDGKNKSVFAFGSALAVALGKEGLEEVVVVILDRAKGKPPAPPESGKAEESGKPPFAAD